MALNSRIIFIFLFINLTNIYSEEIRTVDVSKEEEILKRKDKNLIQLEIGNESLVLGISYYYFINTNNALGFSFGTWLEGPSAGVLYKYFLLKSNISPYTGVSLMLYNVSSEKDETGNVFKNTNIMAFYFPIGLQYMNNGGFVFSLELGFYTAFDQILTLERNLLLANQGKSLSSIEIGTFTRIKPWFGIKIGYTF